MIEQIGLAVVCVAAVLGGVYGIGYIHGRRSQHTKEKAAAFDDMRKFHYDRRY